MSTDQLIPRDALVVRKTIYAKKKSHNYNQEIYCKIIQNEIEFHLRKYPGLKYKSIDKAIKNDDCSLTYNIHFERKKQ